MYPVVWVKSIDTVFLENACGSGTVSTAMVQTILSGKSNTYKIKQPSGEILEADIKIENDRVMKAILKGEIYDENEIKKLII